MRHFALFVGALALVVGGRMLTPPAEPAHPVVEPEPVPMAAIPTPSELPGGGQQPAPQPAAPRGG
ncbi:MAG: hypothetical protein Q8Q09_03395 [Deltaproteobacteria bacterium]|nr:hypothetical protein [Deltaproteobacteria bacterium]